MDVHSSLPPCHHHLDTHQSTSDSGWQCRAPVRKHEPSWIPLLYSHHLFKSNMKNWQFFLLTFGFVKTSFLVLTAIALACFWICSSWTIAVTAASGLNFPVSPHPLPSWPSTHTHTSHGIQDEALSLLLSIQEFHVSSASVSSFICHSFLIPQKQLLKHGALRFSSKLEMPSSTCLQGKLQVLLNSSKAPLLLHREMRHSPRVAKVTYIYSHYND